MNNQDFLESIKREVRLRREGNLLLAFQEGQDRVKRMQVIRESISSPTHDRPLPAEGRNLQVMRAAGKYWL